MARPSGAGFAQFFPTAPRATRDRATEREKARAKTSDPSSSLLLSPDLGAASTNETLSGRPSVDGGLLNGSQSHADGHASPLGDAINTGDSASSLTSNGSSTFSSSRQAQQLPNGASQAHTATVTPLTTVESPSYSGITSHSNPNNMAPNTLNEETSRHSQSGSQPQSNGTSDPYLHRRSAREPGLTRKGIKCIPDTTADRHKRQNAKPTFKEFGLNHEDDVPPRDPRLDESGGHIAYINTDFHLPKSRLRQAPYNLKPYSYDPRTSLGPGPPTQIVVMGFNPLINFAKVSQMFATFGAIAESSNKMHPETGSLLGFATFRYKDTPPSRNRPMPVKANDAARRAVRSMQGQRIESHVIRVEFDPEGKKSRRMLEDTLRKEKSEAAVARAATNATKAPSSHLRASAAPPAGPPPLAPRGPAAQRPTPPASVATPLATPKHIPQSRPQGPIEDQPIKAQLSNHPYIFVGANFVPAMAATIPHMKKRLKAHGFLDIRLDRSGYYIVFADTSHGAAEANRCYRAAHRTEFFNYEFNMVLSLPPKISTEAEPHSRDKPRRRSPTPERKPREQIKAPDSDDRRRREEENDLEEEKRQRAKNFDPVLAACEAVRKELAEHLIKHIRTQVAAPAVLEFLKSDRHNATRQRLNITDPSGITRTKSGPEAGDLTSRVGTPASGADPIEKRTGRGRIEVSALPRIRKAKKNEKDKTLRNYAFADPFARKQRQGPGMFRSLHHRLHSPDDSDADSDDEADVRVSVARETEEPDSRPRSRMSTDDEMSKDDSASWGPAEEDSMTEVSLPTKKRKLDLDAQTAIKRQKKSDQELFGVTLDHIENDLPVHEISKEATPEVSVVGDDRSVSRSETPGTLPEKPVAKKSKSKKKSKKQIFEEREAAKKQHSGLAKEEEEDGEQAAAPSTGALGDAVTEQATKNEKAEPLTASNFEAPDYSIFSHDVVPALSVPEDFAPGLAALQNLPLAAVDGPEFAKLRKKFAAAKLEDPPLWLWQLNRVRDVNTFDPTSNKSPAIEGYYVPNSTGCARTEGVKKILNSEKSKYLPHHIKVQKARKAREARVKDGKDAVAPPAPAPTKGNSRANRANNRRQVTMLQDELKSSGDPDVFKFNQLKKRKKPVKFARSAIHNWGLYTEENINKDDMIIEYVGEQVRQQISEIREKRYLKQGMGSSYLFRIDENTVIDATKKGGIARFINHSCTPNCTAKIIKVDGSKRIVIYALRDITRNEELTYDYKFEREIGAVDRIPCLCGTALCKGFLN